MSSNHWHQQQAEALYQLNQWGSGFFTINDQGHAEAITDGVHRIDLKKLCEELAEQQLKPPLLLRFSDMLKRRMDQISKRFDIAINQAEYSGRYYGVYPIKVNQQRQVVEEIVEFGADYHWGLEAGSKPELHATLAMLEDVEGLIICNGYKDQEFVDLAMIGLKMGKRVFVVVEKPNELELILDAAARFEVEPLIGLRCRMATTSNGLWHDSGGDHSKFGLSPRELLEAVSRLKQLDKLDSLRLLHFHIGSQVPQIRYIKEAMQEAARYFVEVRQLGAPIEFMDVGGGLGVNYDGNISGSNSSVDYSLQEYANDVVMALKNVCDESDLPYPHIISESGRALVAHHAVMIVDVIGITRRINDTAPREPDEGSPVQLRQLWDTLAGFDELLAREALHDVTAYREDINKLFALGHATLSDRAHADDLYWRIISKIMTALDESELIQLEPGLNSKMADRYFCNFSVFQSLPDSWAINQVFPVMPIHRLDEEPDRQAILVDITCDSDGKIEDFPLQNGISPTLPLHTERPGESYLLGIFLTGAYQEILGDLHNLFGDTHAVHIRMDGDHYELEQVVAGESVAEVLDYVQFHEKVLLDRMRRQLQEARLQGRISAREANRFLRCYQEGLQGYTYLEDESPGAV
ncbi:MAG: biosynthetic arginine decarboxylase [Candidatus Thiodiazotropha weberae]|uniref:Biosynthetic arginine decarboxylase n=1 Tax=Candidatus Thiodiazotropha endoloripes TaxID=1818881 RepID=A0A1E2URD5_9GAMM|nr:biosynthetic arginine decarboxylase [Candidatus Thiodiazotropha endoloripes]MCG7900743.1 biosynthetic arginine decarboxylase [Candidatus Thiodiazotropha weberae]MCG7903450.1 biosynthetic arginine decarboxylase [Candidatus Thiodiazotropha weberae]MCG7915556.1 biosynthetic arginine decarboxylase [Candidatus Thiodiazotropha weberae]ODB97270.1 arginine decarboxylase [Candidatus Thiodiazotropha endoloripes]